MLIEVSSTEKIYLKQTLLLMFRVSRSYLFPIVLILISCNSIDESKIMGHYEIDKGVIRDASIKFEEFPLLIMNGDNTFELKHYNKADKIEGNWKLIKSKGNNEATIQFNFQNKTVEGLLKGTIFYFDYPNDLYSGKFERLLYVKLIQ